MLMGSFRSSFNQFYAILMLNVTKTKLTIVGILLAGVFSEIQLGQVPGAIVCLLSECQRQSD